MIKRNLLLVSALLLCMATALPQMLVDKTKLRAWNGVREADTAKVERLIKVRDAARESRLKFDNIVMSKGKGRPMRVASTDPLLSPDNVIDDGTRINFNVVNWYLGDFLGIGNVRPVAGAGVEEVYGNSELAGIGNGVYAGGKYYGLTYSAAFGQVLSATFHAYDAETWEREASIELPAQWYSVYDYAAYNPKDGKIYVLGFDGYHLPYLSVLDTGTGTYTQLVQCNVGIAAMAFDADGNLFAITQNGDFERIDLTTGLGTPLFRVEDEGVTVQYWQALAFDYHTGELFWIRADNNFNESLRLIDIASETVTTVTDLPQFGAVGAWVDSPEAPDDAPNTVSALSVAFGESGSHIGDISATAPSTTFSGDALTGDVTLKFSVDGSSVGERTVAAGETAVLENIDFLASGEHKVAVTVSNSNGSSPSGTITAYCGPDTPNPVSNVVLSVDDNGLASLSWDAPTAGVHGGYFDAGKLTYEVVRNPDNVVVAENLMETALTDQLSSTLSRWSYTVTVACDGIEGDAVTSNSVVYGDGYTVPFETQLGDETFFNLCSVFNNDGDDYTFYTTWGSVSCNNGYTEGEIYNSDDWLITAPIYLEKGNYLYEITYAALGSGVDATFTMGDRPVPEAQTKVLGEVENLLYEDGMQTLKVYIKAEEAGKYYFGIHFTSEAVDMTSADMPYGSFYDLKITPGPDDGAPAKVADLKVEPFAGGELKAEVSFTAPSATFAGGALQSIEKIEVCNGNDEVLGTVSDAVPGGECSLTVSNVSQGVNVYHVYAYNDKGRGELAEIAQYIGNDIPGSVQNIATSIESNRCITFSWDAPLSVGVNGGYVNPENVTYNFCRSEYDYVPPFAVEGATGLTERTFTYEETSPTFGDTQHIYYYGVQPVNEMGEGILLYSGFVLGKPYQAPFKESFAGGTLSTAQWTAQQLYGLEGWIQSTGTGTVAPFDEDGGMLLYSTTSGELTGSAIVTPILELKDMKKPVVSFYMYHNPDSENAYLSVQASKDDADYAQLALINVNEGSGWTLHKLPLDDFNGSDRVFIALLGASEEAVDFAVDDIQVYDDINTDIAVTSLSAPEKLELNEEGEFVAEVVSKGLDDVAQYTVDFYAGGVKVASVDGTALTRNVPVAVTAKIVPNASNANSTVEYEARVNLASDENELNDAASATVQVTGTELPAPTGLRGDAYDGQVRLAWSGPTDEAMSAMSDSFEDYEAFAITSQGGWTFLDKDQLMPIGIRDVVYPNMDKGRAFMVWNPSGLDFPGKDAWTANSGDQCLIAFASDYYKIDGSWDGTQQSDEWLISPHVAGGTTVKFYAKAAVSGYTERFEFLISYGSKDTGDFTLLGEQVAVTGTEWKQYEYQLPADAVYFAIRYCSQGWEAFSLLIDDVEYTAGYNETTFVGYNVYANGILANEEPVTALEYVLPYDSADDNVYGVSAVYEEGESEMVTVEINQGGIDSLQPDGVKVVSDGRQIIVTGAAGRLVNVYNTLGQLLASRAASDYETFDVGQSALYLVEIDGVAYKVMVK